MSGAAAFAAAAGYPAGTMVYYAGGYRCTDLHQVRHLVDHAVPCAVELPVPHAWPLMP